MAAAAAAPDLDCLIEAHDRFLSSVLNRALLGGGQAEALRQTLTKLLTNCMDLAGPVRQLRDKVRAGLLAGSVAATPVVHLIDCNTDSLVLAYNEQLHRFIICR